MGPEDTVMRISAVIITYNEEDRLPGALASLRGVADEVVVVDSYSGDRTVEIARTSGARVLQNRFEDYGRQKNFAMEQAAHEWILNLDADERVSPELKRAISALKEKGAAAGQAGFAIQRRTHYLGRWIRHSGWYPDRKVRLFRKSNASWQGRIHERLNVTGTTACLPGAILHFTYRGISDHLSRINRYSSLQAEEIAEKGKTLLLCRALVLPVSTFARHYLLKLGFLDGFPGFLIALFSSWATALKYCKALELKRAARRHGNEPPTDENPPSGLR
jgi:glycosyltransferase involved in cell wall biosynthesis